MGAGPMVPEEEEEEDWHLVFFAVITLYRLAQNKILHQTICNIIATSGQILKILEAV